MALTDETPLAMLTVGQLKRIIEDSKQTTTTPKHVVYGLKGICDLFSCGLSRAQDLKRTIISGAVSQQGRTIVTDVDLALQLFEDAAKKQKQ